MEAHDVPEAQLRSPDLALWLRQIHEQHSSGIARIGQADAAPPVIVGTAYLGVPVLDAAGRTIGSLGVTDAPGRSWTDQEVEVLRALAEGCSREIRLREQLETARRASAALRERTESYQQILRHYPDGAVFLFDRDLRYLAADGVGLTDVGLSRETLEGKRPRDVLPADVCDVVEPLYRAALAGETTTREAEYAGRIYLAQAIPVRDADAEVVAGMVVTQDVTSRRRAEERQRFLEAAAELLTSTLDYQARLAHLARLSVPTLADYCLVDVLDEDGELHRIEAAHADPAKESLVRALLRYPPVEERPEGVSRAIRQNESILRREVDHEVLRESAQSREHLEIVRALGPRAFLTVPLALRGTVLGAITFVMSDSGRSYDEADLRLAEDLAARAAQAIENARLYERARRAVRAREEVLRVVSHELRNPLSAILISLESLLEAPDALHRPEREREALDAVHRFTRHMVRLVDDLVDVTRAETGHLTVRRQPEDVGSLVAEALELVRPLIEDRRLSLRTSLPEAAEQVAADRGRVVQVLGNLLGNALKFTPGQGTITLAVRREGPVVRFEVKDTGPGIPPDELPLILDRTRRRKTAPGGTGLGLSIAQGIVRAHGGQIGVRSSLGQGATFWFTLPVAAASADPAASESDEGEVHDVSVFAPRASRVAAEGSRGAPRQPRPSGDARGRRSRFLSRLVSGSTSAAAQDANTEDLLDTLRDRIMGAVDLGHLRPGDRLPSMRDVAREFGTSHHTVSRAYEALAAEGLVDPRERSGVYVADPSRLHQRFLSESGLWLADVLTEAWEHQIKIPRLPELIRRWTATVRLRCACVEESLDHRTALCDHISRQFGLECVPVEVSVLDPSRPPEEADLPAALREADLFVTTVFHAPVLRPIAAALDRPLVVAQCDPAVVHAVERRLGEAPLALICADPRFGDRVRSLHGSGHAYGLRVISSTDRTAIAALPSGEPVLLTGAAQESLRGVDVRMLVPRYPAYSVDSARYLAELLIQLNVEAQRIPAV